MQRKQQGFTLIELVIVIVILGVLSAFALPRFADLGSDARAATIQGAAGAMRSASAIVRSTCLARSACDDDDVIVEGTLIALENGYASVEGIMVAAQLEDDFQISGGEVRPEGVAADANCVVTYTAAVAADPDDDTAFSPPTIVVNTGGC